MPQTAEETLAVDLIRFAESFTLAPELDAALLREFGQSPGAVSPRRYPQLRAGMEQAGRWLAISAATLALVALTVLVMPPLRSLAQDILRQIGVIAITDAPTGYDVFSTQPAVSPDATSIPGIERQVYEMRTLSLAEVTALTGFHALVAGYVPEGYFLSARDVWQRNGMNSVSAIYYNPTADASVSIAQTVYDSSDPAQSREFAVGDAAIVDVTVRGVPGVWAEQVTTWPPGAHINMLFWQEGEFTFMMQSSALSLDDVLSVAESLE